MQRKSSPEVSSPESMRRFKAQLEADIDALSPHSSDPEIFDPEGKTTAEIAAWCAEYERGKRRDRRLMAKRRRMGIAGLCHWGGKGSVIIVYSLFYCLQPSELCGPAQSLQLLPFLERVPVQQQGLLRIRTR